jgi:hypothetical protein
MYFLTPLLPVAGFVVLATSVVMRISSDSIPIVLQSPSSLELALIGMATLGAYAIAVRWRRDRSPNVPVVQIERKQASSKRSQAERPKQAA